MNFAMQPQNDFLALMHDYHERCKRRVPQIRALAAKWTFEDLVPGLSDVDMRFVVAGPMSAADWSRMSLEVGRVHADLCREDPRRGRTLEHLPGINLTMEEMTHPALFDPEFHQWTFYKGNEGTIEQVRECLSRVAWSGRDERHHLRRFATFVGPYHPEIDPPINLGPWQNKYALHSRYMHYFAAPVQAAVSLHQRRNVAGKLEALRIARDIFPAPQVIDQIFAAISRHYEISIEHAPARLGEIDRQLEAYLRAVWSSLHGQLTLVEPQADDDLETIRRRVAAIPDDPAAEFFAGARVGRLLEGRLRFYGQTIPNFGSKWLIRNELQRIVSNLYTKPLTAYGQLRFGSSMSADQVVDRLDGVLLDEQTCEGIRRFARIAGEPIPPRDERGRARAVADAYPPVLVMLEALGADLLSRAKTGREAVAI